MTEDVYDVLTAETTTSVSQTGNMFLNTRAQAGSRRA